MQVIYSIEILDRDLALNDTFNPLETHKELYCDLAIQLLIVAPLSENGWKDHH